MEPEKILSSVFDNDPYQYISERTQARKEALHQVLNAVREELTEDREDLYFELDGIIGEVETLYFDDGVIYGMDLVKNINNLINNPYEAYEKMQCGYISAEELNKKTMDVIEKYKRAAEVWKQ